MSGWLHRCLTRTPIAGVLLAALVFRALIPAGFMPSFAADGAPVMTLCAGFEVQSASGASDEDAASGHTSAYERSSCAFAATPPATPPPAALAFGESRASLPRAAAPASPFADTSLQRAQTSRGPPSL